MAQTIGKIRLENACTLGDLDEIKLLISIGVNPNIANRYGSPLHIACKTGHLHVLKWLYDEASIDLNICDFKGSNLIDVAVLYNHTNILEWLLEKNVNVKIKQKNNRSTIKNLI